MMNVILNTSIVVGDAVTEKITVGEALLFSLVGFAIVFAVLIGLVLVLMLVSKVTGTDYSTLKDKIFKKSGDNNSAAAQTDGNIAEAVKADGKANDSQLVAVITAAIAAIYDSEIVSAPDAPLIDGEMPVPFKIKSIKHFGG